MLPSPLPCYCSLTPVLRASKVVADAAVYFRRFGGAAAALAAAEDEEDEYVLYLRGP